MCRLEEFVRSRLYMLRGLFRYYLASILYTCNKPTIVYSTNIIANLGEECGRARIHVKNILIIDVRYVKTGRSRIRLWVKCRHVKKIRDVRLLAYLFGTCSLLEEVLIDGEKPREITEMEVFTRGVNVLLRLVNIDEVVEDRRRRFLGL